MALKAKKKKVDRAELPGAVQQPVPEARHTARVVRPRRKQKPDKVEPEPDLDMEWLREGAGAADPRELEELTDRVFASVLARCGWQRNERGQIEHVGGQE